MKSTQLRNAVLLALVVVALASSLATAWRTRDWGGLVLNLSTEMIGAVATYALFELLIRRREELKARKAALIAQMGSSVKDVAIAASEELRRHGWHRDGSLQRASLIQANLPGANLSDFDLQRAYLLGANLQGAALYQANLQAAHLFDANLQEAYLLRANLQGTYLENANLQGAEFDKYTTLPDGTRWTPGTDMARFTDPKNPDFWRPDAQ